MITKSLLFGLPSNGHGSAGKLCGLKLSSRPEPIQNQKAAFYCWCCRHRFCDGDFGGFGSLLSSIAILESIKKTNNEGLVDPIVQTRHKTYGKYM